jgi:hypothetical protein
LSIGATPKTNRTEQVLPFFNTGDEADGKEWLNCEAKVFTFEADDDEDAVMYEIPPKKKIAPEVKSG